MPKFLRCFFFLVFLFATHRGRAAEIPLIKEPVNIGIGQTQEFGFGSLSQRDTTVLLKIRSRMDSKSLAGSSEFMNMELNGQPVLAAKGRSAIRLQNKPLISPVLPTISATWFSAQKGWRVVYAPDFKAALAQKFYADDPYLLVLDITDLVNPIAENRLKITNTATDVIKQYSGTDAALVLDSLVIGTLDKPSPMMDASNNFQPVINRGEPAAGPAKYTAKVLAGGGFTVGMGQNIFRFSSAFSFPNAGFNRLNAGDADRAGQKEWQVKVDPKSGRVTASGREYSVRREIKFTPGRIEISDAITNKTNAPLGLSVRHETDLSALQNPEVRIAGSPDPTTNDYYAPGNPSVHVRLKNQGLGIIAEDDVLRNQALLYTRNASDNQLSIAGLRTDMLRLSPGETTVLRWAVYPVDGPDYYDFINAVRRDWKANITAIGACWWMSSPEQVLNLSLEDLRATLQNNGISYVQVTGSWVDHKLAVKGVAPELGFGTGVLDAHFSDYRRRVREATEKIRAAVPSVKVLGYYDAQRDSSANNQQQFADSAFIDEAGKQPATDWNGRYSLSYSMVPTLQNNFGKAMVAAATRYMDEMKLDGIYWDEMALTRYGVPEITFNLTDGHSAILNPKTWTIEREAGITPLVSAPFRRAVIRAVQDKNGLLLGNGPATTLDELHTSVQRMVEMWANDVYVYQGHLGTPLGFSGDYNDWKAMLRAFNFAMLPITGLRATGAGKPFSLPHEIMPHLFPFTPVELHAGYLLGRERIIATHSGNYGWRNERALAQVFRFDNNGKLKDASFVTTIGNEARTSVALAENEAVVLERVPLSLVPTQPRRDWNAEVSQLRYDARGASLKIKAPRGGVLTLKTGVLPLSNGTTVSVQIGSAAARRIKIAQSTVRVLLPQKFNGVVRIEK
jgi:hypothetical protein